MSWNGWQMGRGKNRAIHCVPPHYRVNCPDGGHQINSFYVQHFHSSMYKGGWGHLIDRIATQKKTLNKDESMQG